MLKKMQVNKRAVFARLQRRFKKKGLSLKTCSPHSKASKSFGIMYIVDQNNEITVTNLNFNRLIEEEKILKGYEELEE